MSIGNWLKNKLTKTITIGNAATPAVNMPMATPLPMQATVAQTVTPQPVVKVQAPPVVKPANSKYVPVPVKPEFKLQETAQKYANLPAGYLAALVMQESRMGEMKPQNTKEFAGKWGWLVGLRNSAVQHLQNKGIKVNTDTPEGVIKAAADYTTLRQKGTTLDGKGFFYSDPVELYAKRYYGKDDTKESFKQYLDYYNKK